MLLDVVTCSVGSTLHIITTVVGEFNWQIWALITGVTGQDGAYLASLLLSKGYEVFGLHARRSSDTLWRLRRLGGRWEVHLLEGDLTDLASLIRMEKSSATEVCTISAQQSFVAISWSKSLYNAGNWSRGIERVRGASDCQSGRLFLSGIY